MPLFEDRSDGVVENDPTDPSLTVDNHFPCRKSRSGRWYHARLRDITRCYLQSHGFQGLCPSGAGESGGAGMKVREPATRRADITSLFLLARTSPDSRLLSMLDLIVVDLITALLSPLLTCVIPLILSKKGFYF